VTGRDLLTNKHFQEIHHVESFDFIKGFICGVTRGFVIQREMISIEQVQIGRMRRFELGSITTHRNRHHETLDFVTNCEPNFLKSTSIEPMKSSFNISSFFENVNSKCNNFRRPLLNGV